jgi:NADH-quinone oxidoreductase subunit C
MDVDKDKLLEVCKKLKEELDFEHVSCVTGVDMKTHFQTVYHISSYQNKVVAEIVVDSISYDNPEVESITPLWGGANWHERETYDMFGIRFLNHPKMERLLLADDFTFFPMRKDYVVGRRVP